MIKAVSNQIRPIKDIYAVSESLECRYASPRHNNKQNPLDELIFIILSVRTSEKLYLKAYRSYKAAFPRHLDALESDVRKIERVIRRAGLSNQRAKAIKHVLVKISKDFGKLSLSSLKTKDEEAIETYLCTLPSVGRKVARCVMMYSLGKAVFPVDAHIWRIARRLGWVRSTNKQRSCLKKDMDRLQAKVPPELRYSLHVNMVAFGRDICLAKKPKCSICPIVLFCKKIGVKTNA